MSVLAHVVLNGSVPSEPAATQALTHILNSSPDIARSFVSILRPTKVDFEPGHIKAELAHEDSRPDLTIHDIHGRVRAIVENKFWAGLTDAQPVSYLRDLPDDPPASLLFIVPQRRVATVWNELKLRCTQEGLEREDIPGESNLTCARAGTGRSARPLVPKILPHASDGGRNHPLRVSLRRITPKRVHLHRQRRHHALDLARLVHVAAFLPHRIDLVEEQHGRIGRTGRRPGVVEHAPQPARGLAEQAADDGVMANYEELNRKRVRNRLGERDLPVVRKAHSTPARYDAARPGS